MQKNKRFEIRIAGFGGQGVVTIGKVLGSAFTIYEGVNSVNTRSYGPESRGGACRSEVVVSRGEIHYPSVRQADVLVALSQPALDKYIQEIAQTVGNIKFQNSVVLGALAALLKKMLQKKSLKSAIADTVPPQTLEKNLEAFEAGWAHIVSLLSSKERI